MSNHDYKEHMELGPLGEVELLVNYDYSPAEAMTMYAGNGDPGEPGCAEDVSICEIICPTLNQMDIDHLITDADRVDLEERILAENHGSDGYGYEEH